MGATLLKKYDVPLSAILETLDDPDSPERVLERVGAVDEQWFDEEQTFKTVVIEDRYAVYVWNPEIRDWDPDS